MDTCLVAMMDKPLNPGIKSEQIFDYFNIYKNPQTETFKRL